MAKTGHQLTGSDHFHLLIDRQMRQRGLPGNISLIHLHLSPLADLTKLREKLEADPTLGRIRHLRLRHNWPFIPQWVETDDDSPAIFIHNDISQQHFNHHVLNSTLRADSVPVRVDLCTHADGSKHLVIAMHHALFDHHGMMLFVRALASGNSPSKFFIGENKVTWHEETSGALRGMLTALGSGGWRLATLAPASRRLTSHAHFVEMTFTQQETLLLDDAAAQSGSRPGKSIFHLAVTLVALRELMEERGQRPPYFWVPVPHDMRRKGAEGHLVGNDLSFFFYKVQRENLSSVSDAVASILEQLNTQVRKGVLRHQASLQRVFRRIPFWMMNGMVGLTTGGRVSSFAFSDLGEERNPIRLCLGEAVTAISHYPPVPFPPGLSVVFGRNDGCAKFVLGHLPEVLNERETARLAGRMRELLLRA